MGEARLVIVGGGDFGRDIARVAAEIPPSTREWTHVAGFLDDDPAGSTARMRAASLDLEVIGPARSYEPRPDDRFVCGIAAPTTKLELCRALRERGAVFTNVIDPTAHVSSSAVLGAGVFLWRHVVVGPCARIADYATVQLFTSIGHDSSVGEGATLSSFCDVMGHAQLGEGAFLGSHASILPGARVGEFARVGAGSVVIKRAPARTTVIGVPARVLGFR